MTTYTNPEMTQMLEFSDKDFKTTSITMFGEVKENMLVINYKVGNIYHEIDMVVYV